MTDYFWHYIVFWQCWPIFFGDGG